MINLTFINSHKLKSPIPYIDVNRAYKRLLWELAIDFDQHFGFMAFLPTKSSRNPFTQFVISRKDNQSYLSLHSTEQYSIGMIFEKRPSFQPFMYNLLAFLDQMTPSSLNC